MKKIIILSTLILVSLSVFSQKKKKLTNNRLSVKLGIEYRITPIHKSPKYFYDVPLGYKKYNLDKHLSGTSLNYAISYEIFKNFHLGFSQSIRYDHLYYEDNLRLIKPNAFESYTFNDSKNTFITDYHLFVKKDFALKRNKIFLKLGLSVMNRGTDYSFTRITAIYDNGVMEIITDEYDSNFFAINACIGMEYKKFDFSIGAYFIDKNSSNLDETRDIVMPYFKISYRIF